MSGKDGKVEINSTMNVTQEEWDKIFGKKEKEDVKQTNMSD